MSKFTLSQLKTLSRKTQALIAIVLLLGLGASTLLAVQGSGQPHNISAVKQAAKTQKAGPVLGANTNSASAEAPVIDTPKSPTASGSTHQQTSTNQPATTTTVGAQGSTSTPAPTPTPDPCDKVVAGAPVTYADTAISFVESVTIPVGCSTGPFTVKTTDSRTVTFYGFSNKPTSPVRANMVSGGTSTGSSANYTVVVTDAATPGYYEDFAYVEDSSSPYGGFAVTVKITVIAR